MAYREPASWFAVRLFNGLRTGLASEEDKDMNAMKAIFLTAAILVCTVGCGLWPSAALGDFPESPGYLRATGSDFGELVIFDADTFEIYRTVGVPRALKGRSHRLERDDEGRIWIGYSQEYTGVLPWMVKEEVRVFSAEGELEHTIQVNADDEYCGPPEGGIAFANGYAFIGCMFDGFSAKIAVVDTESMEIVKTLEVGRPHPEIPGVSDFFLNAIEEVSGSILVLGSGKPPIDYNRVSNVSGGVALIARIAPITLTLQDYKAELPPGSRALDVVEVNGMAWLLNIFSHVSERPPRRDIYVMNPNTLEVVDSFNLPSPFPKWGEVGSDGHVYIYHMDFLPKYDPVRDTGVSWIDPLTREATYAAFEGVAPSDAAGFGVYRGRPCVASGSGLRCMNYDRSLELAIDQESSIGILFPPSSDRWTGSEIIFSERAIQ